MFTIIITNATETMKRRAKAYENALKVTLNCNISILKNYIECEGQDYKAIEKCVEFIKKS